MEDGQTVGRRKFLTLLGLSPTAPLFTHITQGDIAAFVDTSGARRSSTGLSGIWFDIRDYGDISSGTITTALQATIKAIGASGKCKTIMIPQVAGITTMTQGSITLPDPTGDPPWTLIYACSRITFTATLSIPHGTTIKGDFGSGQRGTFIGARGPNMAHIVGGNTAGDPVILCNGTKNCTFANLAVDSNGIGLKLYQGAGYIIKNCSMSGSEQAHGGLALLQPALLIDSCFWMQCYDSEFQAFNGSAAIEFQASNGGGIQVSGGLANFYNTTIAGSRIYVHFDTGPQGGNIHFDGLVAEGLGGVAGESLLDVDSTNVSTLDITMNRAELADSIAPGPAYLFKNTGSSTANIKFTNTASFNMHPSSAQVHGLLVSGGTGQNYGGVIAYPGYNPEYGYEWPDTVDKRLTAAPRAPQWTIGTIRPVNQDSAGVGIGNAWSSKSAGATKTTGVLAPDGTTNAIQLSGTTFDDHIYMYDQNHSLTVGDWIIAGCWVQAVDPANGIGGNQAVALELLYAGGTNGTRGGDTAMYHSDADDGAWKWCCGAFKVLTLGSGGNPCDRYF